MASSTNPQCFYVPKENDNIPPPLAKIVRRESIIKESPTTSANTKNKSDQLTICDVCQGDGNNANLVRYVPVLRPIL